MTQEILQLQPLSQPQAISLSQPQPLQQLLEPTENPKKLSSVVPEGLHIVTRLEAAVEDGNGKEDEKKDEEDAGRKVDEKKDDSGLENSQSRKVLPAWQGRKITVIYNTAGI
jgi:hypothetical protein